MRSVVGIFYLTCDCRRKHKCNSEVKIILKYASIAKNRILRIKQAGLILLSFCPSTLRMFMGDLFKLPEIVEVKLGFINLLQHWSHKNRSLLS